MRSFFCLQAAIFLLAGACARYPANPEKDANQDAKQRQEETKVLGADSKDHDR